MDSVSVQDSKKNTKNKINLVDFKIIRGDPLITGNVSLDRVKFLPVVCLLDSGATLSFIREGCKLLEGQRRYTYPRAKEIRMIDGSTSKLGSITQYVNATMHLGPGLFPIRQKLDIAELGGPDIILGADFHHRNQVKVDWETMTLLFPNKFIHAVHIDPNAPGIEDAVTVRRAWVELEEDSEEWDDPMGAYHLYEGIRYGSAHPSEFLNGLGSLVTPEPSDDEVQGRSGTPTEEYRPTPPETGETDFDYLGDEDWEDMEADQIKELVPAEFHGYLDVFRKSLADKLPPHRDSDHRIELIPEAKLKASGIYKLGKLELD
jgi:hypothetical protein